MAVTEIKTALLDQFTPVEVWTGLKLLKQYMRVNQWDIIFQHWNN